MTCLRSSSLLRSCGTWFGSFATLARSPLVKDISMIKCFGISLDVTEIARPMPRRQTTERRELPLPSLRLDWHSDSHQQRVIFHSDLLAESCRVAAPRSCGIEEPSRCWTRKTVHSPAA